MIPCSSPLSQYRSHKTAIDAAVIQVLDGGSYILGQGVEKLERDFAAYCGTGHAVGVANGTDALTLTLRAMNIGPMDEVITVSHTALATVAAILATGATPRLVDVDAVYYTMDPDLIEAAITPKTRAIIVVHLYGQSADMNAIMAIARRHSLRVIEDCAQSTGGFYQGKRLGSIGDAGTFSFYPTKNLGAIGDGGMVVTSDKMLADRVSRLRQYGWDAARNTQENGYNSRLDPIQAAILSAKLPSLDTDNERRAWIASRYTDALAGLDILAPETRPECRHVFHLYVVQHTKRDTIKAALLQEGIECGVHYQLPAHKHAGYAEKTIYPKKGLPVTDRLSRNVLSLPMYPELSNEHVNKIISACLNALQRQ